MAPPAIHRFQAGLFPVNAYVVELADGIVVVDATLGMSDGRALRQQVETLRKPLRAVVVTHTHPDHYGGLAALVHAGEHVPVFATQGVCDVIQRDDPAKEQTLRPMFGDEWARQRTFPNRVVRDGERLRFGEAVLRVVDLGPGESPHDSLWLLESEGPVRAFVGDLVYNGMHSYLADGFHQAWLANLWRVKNELGADITFYPGHGAPGRAGDLVPWQEGYIRTFLDALRSASTSSGSSDDAVAAAVTSRMKAYLPGDALLFLMQLSIGPMRSAIADAGGRG
jgi:glyoxylase-like metal-dependent hydrolase (beta-lactamase superfamily II)